MTADIRSQTREEVAARFAEWGEPAYRADQLLDWLYVHWATSWDAMTNLSQPLRAQLRTHYALATPQLVRVQGARDTTRKFLWRLTDHALIETVLIPASPALYGEPSDRHTLCVSTQVGCAYGCKFCASGLDGWKRHLRVEEIVGQVVAVEQWHRLRCDRSQDLSGGSNGPRLSALNSPPSTSSRLINNLVIMGMGEPLANYDNLLKALTILNAPWGGRIGARKITVSTSGLAPQIRQLADQPLQFGLALSLHGATDDVRSRIMPINHRYPLATLVAACEHFQRNKGRMITFEYILIDQVNDRLDQAEPLARLARRLHAKVNLIPYNRVEGLPWSRPDEKRQEAFLAALRRRRVKATLRREKGHDIDAACGQLRLKTERGLVETERVDRAAAGNIKERHARAR